MSFTSVTIRDCTLYHGDCLEVLPTIARVDAVVTDPPYGIALRNGDVDGHRSDRWDSIAGDKDDTVGREILQRSRNGGASIIAFASPWKPWPGRWRNLVVWDKGGAVGGGGDIRTCLKRSWELIQVWNQDEIAGGRGESVWRYPIVPNDTADHIAAKPVELMQRLLDVFVRDDAVIVDPFMGSGTTGVACVRTGRKFIGIEIEKRYFDIAVRRIREAYEQTALFDGPVAPVTQLELSGVTP
jgi:DNA modification methylase